MAVVYTLFLLLETSIKWMHKFAKKHSLDIKSTDYKKAKDVYEKASELTGNCESLILCTSGGLFKDLDYNWLIKAQKNTNASDFKVQMVMNKKNEKGEKIELFKTVKEFNNLISDWANNWDDVMKNQYLEFFRKEAGILKNLVKGIKESIADILQGVLDTITEADDVTSIFSVLGNMMGIIADSEEAFIAIGENSEYKNKDFNSLTKSQQQDIATQFGLKNNQFEENSVLDGLFKVVNNKTFIKTFLNEDSPLYQFNSKNVQDIHESLLQYALDDKYWKIDEKSFKLNGAISGADSLNSKFSYSIEYKGVGDKDVTKFLDQPVTLPDNFNPIEPWHTPSPTNVSKDWTVQDHIDYTGLGNGEFKDVNFKYNIEWSNVSDKPEFPYWVITKIDLFRNENGQWKQFYPVI